MDLNDFKGIVRNLTQSAEDRAVARALQHYARGQIDKGIAVLKEAQSESPENPAVLLELGRLLTYAQKPAEAAEAFRTILRKNGKALAKIQETIEELRARHAGVGPLYDAIAEHYVRHDNLPQALQALERMKPEELRPLLPRYRNKYEPARRTAPDTKLTRTALLPAYHLALVHEALREHDRAVQIYRDIVRTNKDEANRALPRLEALAARDYQNADLRLEVASMLHDAGRSDEAVRQFGTALETSPQAASKIATRLRETLALGSDSTGLRWVMAQAHITAGDDPAAIEAMRPLIVEGRLLDEIIQALQPLVAKEKPTQALLLLAEAFSRRGQPIQSLGPLIQVSEESGLKAIHEPLQRLVDAHPDVVRAHQLLADIHLEAGRTAEAVTALARARELAPREAATLLPRLSRAMQADRTSPEVHIMLADIEMDGGDSERAVVVLRHLLREAPAAAGEALERLNTLVSRDGGPRARIGAAEACLALGRFPEALPHLEAVATAQPDMSAEFLHPLGLLTAQAPDLAPRIVTLLHALEPRSPLPVAVHFARGEAQFRAGDPAAAAASFREVLQSAPERVQEVRQALERFDRADARAAEARYLLAGIYLDQRDHAAALRELSRPGATHATLLARVLKKYDEILAEAPQDLAARAGLLQALIMAREFDRVLEVGRDTLKIRDDNTTAGVSVAMGDALSEKGDSDGAVRRYFTAYKRDPALGGEVIDKMKRLLDLEGKHPFTCLALGKVLVQERRAKEAVEALRAAHDADPALADAVILELEGLVRSMPADPAPGLMMIALLQGGGQNARAVQAISMHLDAHPDSAQRLAAHLDAIIKAEPDHPLAQYEQGRALQKLSAFARSADRYRAAARLDNALGSMALRRLQEILIADPDCTVAWIASADVLAARGQPLQAAERLGEAIARSPKDVQGLLARMEELYLANEGQGDLALLFAAACMQAGQHDRAAKAYADASERDLSFCEAALLGFDAIIKASPRLPDAFLMRARTRLRLSQADPALADFITASRLAPRLAPSIATELESLVQSRPFWMGGALYLADLYEAGGRGRDAETLLAERIQAAPDGESRLKILLRLAQSASARGDETAARGRMREAAALAADRRAFLAHVHEMQISLMRRRVTELAGRIKEGSGSAPIIAAVEACIDLGDLDQAQEMLDAHATTLGAEEARRLRAALAIRSGDYLRASEQLRALGPSPLLAFGALRTGDYVLAIETLEALLARRAAAPTQALLERTYRDMVAADLMGGSRRLQAETTLSFGEGVAA